MEYINKVELQGIVGSIYPGSFSLLTNEVYDKEQLIEPTWHHIRYANTSDLKKMDAIHVIGKLKVQEYVNSNGVTIRTPVVIATKLKHV